MGAQNGADHDENAGGEHDCEDEFALERNLELGENGNRDEYD